MKKRFLMVKTSLEHIKAYFGWKTTMTNAHNRIQAKNLHFQDRFKSCSTLPYAKSRRELSKSSGILEIENISVLTKH